MVVVGFREVNKRIDPIHDFMIEHKGIEKGRTQNKGATNKDLVANLFKIIFVILLILAAFVKVDITSVLGG